VLRITIESEPGMIRLKLEGKLSGPWVEELGRAWTTAKEEAGEAGLLVDLSRVVYIDGEGKALLARLYEQGAKLQAAGCLTRCIVEQIQARSNGARTPEPKSH
jgi:ABC-type transporter Mla MlaB component